uniref:THD domain-containing protein n=1 Tax=Cyclopterus lumpus TaxID=8103 RepID=A0A8C2WE81_CYCLU
PSLSLDEGRTADSIDRDELENKPRNNFNGKYLEWERLAGRAFCNGGFNYSSGNLMVPRLGIYRVFLQITYESKNNLECDEELRLSNSVFLIRDDYKTHVPLLSSVDTLSCSMKQWSKTLYTAGLFSLEADSRLQVTSSHPSLIVESESKVFFGAELLFALSH